MAAEPAALPPLDALVSLISSSVADITAEYNAAGLPLPALDAPAASAPQATLSDGAGSRVARAVKIVEAACAQLCATISHPGHVLLNKATAYEESVCLQIVTDAKIADLLLDKSEGVHVLDLSTATGLNSDKLARVLRLLATGHVFREVKPDVFANNRTSLELLSTKPCHPVVDIITNEQLKAAAYLNETLKDPLLPAPFKHVFGVTIMDYFTAPDGQQRRDVWARGIAGWGDAAGDEGLHKIYPWFERLKASAPITICDIGAGNGHVLLDLLRAFPSEPIRAVVQDLPPILNLSREFWETNYPKAIQDSQVDFVPINFFEDSPVDGCDYYYMRFCLHNWSDELCVRIMSNIVNAMQTKTESRFLIHDIVLQHPVSSASGTGLRGRLAPAPLLPNFGASCYREYAGDLNMMVLLDAKERSLHEIVALGAQAGLVLERVYESGDTSVIEFMLA